MNINEIFNKVKSQFSRVTGKTFDENLSETEVLAEMENMPSLAEQSATFQTGLDELNTQFGEFKAKLDVIENAPKFTLEEVVNKINEAVKLSSDQLKTSFATEISALKQLAETNRKPAGETLTPTIESIAPAPEVVQKEMEIGGKKLKF